MTSKEALEKLLYCASLVDTGLELDTQEYARIIKQDLDALEIIKKHIVGKTVEYGTCFDDHNTISLVVEITQLKDFTDKLTGRYNMVVKLDNDFDIIKEWLVK